jgi:hypothetical protein
MAEMYKSLWQGNFVLPKARGVKGAKGARSRFRELDQAEISRLSTAELIKYAKAQARDIFTTGGAGMATSSRFVVVPDKRITPELESSLTSYMGKRGFWEEVVSPFGKAVKTKPKEGRKLKKTDLDCL